MQPTSLQEFYYFKLLWLKVWRKSGRPQGSPSGSWTLDECLTRLTFWISSPSLLTRWLASPFSCLQLFKLLRFRRISRMKNNRNWRQVQNSYIGPSLSSKNAGARYTWEAYPLDQRSRSELTMLPRSSVETCQEHELACNSSHNAHPQSS